jgi:hypothetical protein
MSARRPMRLSNRINFRAFFLEFGVMTFSTGLSEPIIPSLFDPMGEMRIRQ